MASAQTLEQAAVLAALVSMPQRLAAGMGRKATPGEVVVGHATFLSRGADLLRRPRGD